MRRLSGAIASLALGLGVGCSSDPGAKAGAPTAAAPQPHPDYLVIAPRSAADELAPLVELRRRQGHDVLVSAIEDIAPAGPSSDAIRAAIAAVADAPGSKLRFVLLAGHPLGAPALPTFTHRQGDWAMGWGDVTFSSDHDYALFERHHLAVGRLPARTDGELAAMVDKLVRYELGPPGAWQKRVMVVGGPADFGPVADALIEWQATTLLDQVLPYDYDVNVLFAKPDSPYAYRFDKLGQKIVDDMNQGALLAVYAGHGNPESFDTVYFRGYRFPIGTMYDLEDVDVRAGAPFFISLTCHTGAFGRARRSLGETLAANPNGPVAVFGSSEVSHPYPNFLYAETLLENLLEKRASTLGEAIVMAKRAMPEKRILAAELLDFADHDAIKEEHLALYNLLGDPATRLRYPAHATTTLDSALVPPNARVTGNARAAELGDGEATITIETERSALRGELETISRDSGPIFQAFETMVKNYAIAADKVVARRIVPMKAGLAPIELEAPSTPGRYVVKVLLSGTGGVASTHARFEVAPRAD